MFNPSHTSIQSLANCSKKVRDMILYVVSKKMAQQLLSTRPESDQHYSVEISQQKKCMHKA